MDRPPPAPRSTRDGPRHDEASASHTDIRADPCAPLKSARQQLPDDMRTSNHGPRARELHKSSHPVTPARTRLAKLLPAHSPDAPGAYSVERQDQMGSMLALCSAHAGSMLAVCSAHADKLPHWGS